MTEEEIMAEIKSIRDDGRAKIRALQMALRKKEIDSGLEAWCEKNSSEYARMVDDGELQLDGHFSVEQIVELLRIAGYDYF